MTVSASFYELGEKHERPHTSFYGRGNVTGLSTLGKTALERERESTSFYEEDKTTGQEGTSLGSGENTRERHGSKHRAEYSV